MSTIAVGQDLRGLIKILGLPKKTRWFELRVATNEIVTIKCGYVPEIDDTNKGELEEVLAEFELRLKHSSPKESDGEI